MDTLHMLQTHFIMKMAGLVIEVDSPSPRTCILCRHYLSSGEPDIKVKVTEEDVQREINHNRMLNCGEAYLETIAVYRKIVEQATYFNVFLMHGATVAVENASFMFTAPSGTGKTTHIKTWLKNNDKAFVVNGDKPLIRIINEGVFACGTPWCGNENMETNTMVPLKAIVYMERGKNNYIERLSLAQIYPFILQQTYLSANAEVAKKTLSLLLQLQKNVTFWHFQFNNYKSDCYDVAYRALTGKVI